MWTSGLWLDGYVDELAQVVDNQSGTTSFGYDPQGNLANRNGVAYTFDVGNRLRNVTSEEGGYAYDAWGRRVAQTDISGTIYSFYDYGGQLIYQLDRAGGTHDYLYLGGKLVGIRNYDTGGIARGWHFQHTDALGSVIRQTDNSGQEVANTGVVYDAWGGQHGVTPQDGPGYTGHVEDADTNLVYMQQRYYDPGVGRFLSMDPVDASGTDGSNLDRYWYANDNPYLYTDPDGRSSQDTMDSEADHTCTGSHIGGGACGSLNLSVMQVGSPSKSEEQKMQAQAKQPAGNSSGNSTSGASEQSSGESNETGEAIASASQHAADLGENSKVSIGKWKGINGKWNSLDWGGNQWTGARASVLKYARALHLAGSAFFAADVVLNASDIRSGYLRGDSGAMVKGGANIGWGVAGTFGGPVGLVGAITYEITSGVVQIPAVYNVTVIPVVNGACHLSGC